MKIIANTKTNQFSYDWIEKNGESYLEKDGKRIDIELVALGDGRFSLIKDNKSYDVNISKKEDGFSVRVAGDLFHLNIEDERSQKLRDTIKSGSGKQGEKIIKASIPGLVVKVDLSAGDLVKKGQNLLILEAMKMENIIKAPYDCEVVAIDVKINETVTQNQSLLKIKGLEKQS